jgi:ABC-type phosphate transport system permease subunit
MHRTIARTTAAAAIVTGAILASAGVAGASRPVLQACVGTTFSTAAANLPPGDVGALISDFAQAPDTAHPGLGDGIQELQAGLVPDEVAVNTCND